MFDHESILLYYIRYIYLIMSRKLMFLLDMYNYITIMWVFCYYTDIFYIWIINDNTDQLLIISVGYREKPCEHDRTSMFNYFNNIVPISIEYILFGCNVISEELNTLLFKSVQKFIRQTCRLSALRPLHLCLSLVCIMLVFLSPIL
jgi:hypothetical protein